MKEIAVFLVVALLLVALAQSALAADLKSGWYVNINATALYAFVQDWGYRPLSWPYFYQTPTGQYGPFTVTDPEPFPSYNTRRYISVQSDAYGIGTEQSLILPLYTGLSGSTQIDYLDISVGTNYDPTQMYVSLYHARTNGTNELVWGNKQLGESGFAGTVWNHSTLDDGYFFKITVVPEPSCLAGIPLGIAPLAWFVRRPRRQT